MNRGLAALVVAALGVVAVPLASGATTQTPDDAIVLHVGDHMKVEGQPVGCQVVRRHGAVFVDCHRSGALKGTYGTFMGRRKAMVTHYRSNDVAKVVFVARHHHGAHTCDTPGMAR